MKFEISMGFVALGCFALWAADITPLNVKLGQWESSTTSQTTGQPPIPQEMLDKIPPEARAKMEERMKANRTPTTMVRKSCLKKEDLDKAMTFGADDQACTRTVLTSSSSKEEVRIECNRGGSKQTGMMRIEAADSEHVKGAFQMAVAAGGRAMNINTTFTAKWLGPTCSEKDEK